MSKRNNVLKLTGNALIALSFLGFAFIYYPIIRGYLFPPTIVIADNLPAIRIEKINAAAPLVFNVDPWNKEEYLKALSHGVAHAKGTFMPGEEGTVFLFAHSSDAPWRLTRYNTVFLRLNDLETGDAIEITTNQGTFIYRVREKKVVWPNETEYLTNTKISQLILQTCYPIGTDLKRLLVFADPV
ncbi:sortase [Candidatus Roizmanbacteria bacterium]|nr:sortase [Candidatus Roizmanbacteria bacterium]